MRSFTILALAASVFACKSDAPAVSNQPSEQGRWVVASATRSGRPTHTLDAAYFEFDTAGSVLKTNFTGQEETLAYVVDATGFSTPDGELFKRIDRVSLNDSILDLSTEIQGTPFTFRLRPEVAGADPIVPPDVDDSSAVPLDDDPGEEM